jgi:hypothetical protein
VTPALAIGTGALERFERARMRFTVTTDAPVAEQAGV